MDINEARVFAQKISDLRNKLIPEDMVEVAAKQMAYEFQKYSYQEIKNTMTDVYLPYYPNGFRKFIAEVKEVAEYNRKPFAEREADRKEALRKWNEGLKRLYPDYVESVEDRSVDDILGEEE